MAPPLPRLRPELDIMPSPLPDQPGLLVRDPFRYSEAVLVVPPLLARCLGCFDGAQTEADLRAALTRLTGELVVTEPSRRLIKTLSEAAFLDDDVFAERRARAHAAFAAAPEREPAHAASAYPAERAALARTLDGYLERAPATKRGRAGGVPLGVAAPHVSPAGGIASYAAAYRGLPADLGDRTFVILGTSHYGEPDHFGLTRKPFATPLGATETDARLVAELARDGGRAATVEDYCHAVEHSIEFQVVFLQHLYGPRVKIVPILCGPFLEGPAAGKPPEASDAVARFVDALGNVAAREAERLFFVLGVDMTHIGRRYGDRHAARAGDVDVEVRDRARIARLEAGDAAGFWDLVGEGGTPEQGFDALKWCGSAPFYTFARALPRARGQLLHYEQWNIDEASVVSFGAMAFRALTDGETQARPSSQSSAPMGLGSRISKRFEGGGLDSPLPPIHGGRRRPPKLE
jgi:MEMO1 family protein